MSNAKYLIPTKHDLYTISIISFVLSIMFTIFTLRFSFIQNEFTPVFITYFLFIAVMHITRLIFIKWAGIKNGVAVTINEIFINKYGVKKYERLNDKIPELKKGLSTKFMSLSIFVLTLGFVIYPSIWRYDYKKIPHLFHGSPQHHEMPVPFFRPFEVTDHRISKILEVGFFYYFVFAQLTELFFKGSDLYPWLISIVFYIAAFTLIPIPGSDGYELFRRTGAHNAHFNYPILLTLLIVGAISILVFESIFFTLLALTIAFIFVFATKLWEDLTGGHH